MSDTLTFEDRIKSLVMDVLHEVGLVPTAVAPVESPVATPAYVAPTTFPVADQTQQVNPVVGV
jgi:hypothetical protein